MTTACVPNYVSYIHDIVALHIPTCLVQAAAARKAEKEAAKAGAAKKPPRKVAQIAAKKKKLKAMLAICFLLRCGGYQRAFVLGGVIGPLMFGP